MTSFPWSPRLIIALLCPALLSIAGVQLSAAQIPQASMDALKAALQKRELMPRGFSADAIVQWTWNGTSLELKPPSIRTFAVLEVESVSSHKSTIRIHGLRRTLLHKSEKDFSLSASSEVQDIEIDLEGADITSLVAQIPDLIFFHNGGEALSAVPLTLRDLLPAANADGCCGPPERDRVKACDCAHPGGGTCGAAPHTGMIGLKPPQLKSRISPELENGNNGPLTGHVSIGVDMDASGVPREVWILNPGTPGMAYPVAKTFKDAAFTPATCHDQAIAIGFAFNLESTVSISGWQ